MSVPSSYSLLEQLEKSVKLKQLKMDIEADKKPWSSGKELLKISPTYYHTGNRWRGGLDEHLNT